MTADAFAAAGWTARRLGVVMAPDPDDPREAGGVCNPACARGPDGELYLFPRLVAEGNYSRVGLARVRFDGGVPAGVERLGVALEPEELWERHRGGGGVEDPRITFVPTLGRYVMTYTGWGPLGPRIALARLEFRGKGVVFSAMLLILIVPFQLLMIPLDVMIVRNYGLADSYLGMILPFAVSAIAVFIFRQFFLQLPRELFESARLDGASELTILTRIAIPLAKPAILTAVIVTFIGPWNEFLWPFLVTKQLALQPLAVALANFISTVAARQANPFGAILAGAVVLAVPAVVLFLVFQRHFRASNLGSAIKG